ncbi:hypothetical protein EV175_003394 [Coemansia sp. RSA 1933]|nr:hypothetical protein EV175_003394 [Coemansia sp. RSA 1933]
MRTADISIDGTPEAEDASRMDVSCDESEHDGKDNVDDDENDDEEEDRDNEGDETQSKQPRLMRACDNCRRKKVKCNGTKPLCTHCARMKLACHYSPLVRKKRTRRSLIDKLEERLESMEQMLQPLVERLSPNDPIMGSADSRQDMGLSLASAHAAGIAHSLGIPLPNAPSSLGGGAQQQQFPGYLPQFGIHGAQRGIPYTTGMASGDALSPGLQMPPQHIVEEMVELALVRFAPSQAPISMSSVLQRLRKGRLPEFFICGCIAFAARFSSRPEFSCMPRYNAGREYAKRAAELVSGLVDKPDPDVVFCMVMLSLYEWGCGLGESAWSYTGMATRLAQRLRLHLVDDNEFNENEEDRDTSWASTEWKRRMWWCVYCSDRTSLIVASRPATVHDDDYVVDLPSHDHEWITGTVPSDDKPAGPSTRHAPPAEPAEAPSNSLFDSPSDGGSPESATERDGGEKKTCPLFQNKVPDMLWLVVDLYRTCGRIAEFSNRRRRPVRSNDISRRTMFDILDRELEDLHARFLPCMEFPPRTEWLLSGYTYLGDGVNGMLGIYSICFNLHCMYHAAKIILYRSELPEYEHERIEPGLIARAKVVCVDSAHKQAEIIRWAFDNIPVENWDPKIGMWSLQGASIHVNAALSDDNQIAEQSRKDLEVHLKLHVESDKYYHFNMAIITMLHRVFNLRKQQRLAMSGGNSSNSDTTDYCGDSVGNSSVVKVSEKRRVNVFIKHSTDDDPWIVPRCSSFLGFTYNSSQLRGILNKTIKQTTYGPPESINADGTTTKDQNDPSAVASRHAVSTSLLNEHTQAAASQSVPAPYPSHASPTATLSVIDRRMSADTSASAVSYGLDVSGGLDVGSGLWYGGTAPGGILGANVNSMAQSLPTGLQNLDLHMHSQHSGLNAMAQQQMGYSTMGGIGSISSTGPISNATTTTASAGDSGSSRSSKRSFGTSLGSGQTQGIGNTIPSNDEISNVAATGSNGTKPPAAKTKGTGNRGRKPATPVPANSHPPVKPDGAQNIEKLQRLEELRARVTLLQQLSGSNNDTGANAQGQAARTGGAGDLTKMSISNSNTAGTSNPSSNLSAPQNSSDVSGFLDTFAASLGSVATHLGSSTTSSSSVPIATTNDTNVSNDGGANGASQLWMGTGGMTDTATAAMTGVASGSANQYGLQNLSSQEIQMMLSQLAPMAGGGVPHVGTSQQQHHSVSPNDLTGGDVLSLNPMLLGINPDMGYSSADVQKMLQKISTTFSSSGPSNTAQ